MSEKQLARYKALYHETREELVRVRTDIQAVTGVPPEYFSEDRSTAAAVRRQSIARMAQNMHGLK